jgi:hypothetical protein
VTDPIGASLVGFYFHAFDGEGRIAQQGHFTTDLGNGYVMVEYLDGFMDSAPLPGRQIVHIATVAEEHWTLYETEEAMREVYREGGGPGPAGSN